jgi:hypothetical protein
MNAQPRRALDAWPWSLKKPLYPVIIEKGVAGKGQEARPATRRAPLWNPRQERFGKPLK